MKLNKLWLTSTKIAKRVEEEINILKSKFWINKNLEKTSNNPLKSIDKKWLKKLTLIFHHDKLQSKWLWELWNKITQNINELKQSWDKWDLEKLNLIYASIEKWDIQTLKKILNLTDEELVWLNKILDKQKNIPKLEQLPAVRIDNLPVEFKKIDWISDIKNPELIAEFKSGIYEPISEIKNSSKIIEAEVIESKITENISKLDKILLNIEKLKLSFASKWEKISELFSKTLLEAKNYILWLKKSLKLKRIERLKSNLENIKSWEFIEVSSESSKYTFEKVSEWKFKLISSNSENTKSIEKRIWKESDIIVLPSWEIIFSWLRISEVRDISKSKRLNSLSKWVDEAVINKMRQLKPWDVIVSTEWTRNIVSKVNGDTIEVRIVSLDGSIIKERININ